MQPRARTIPVLSRKCHFLLAMLMTLALYAGYKHQLIFSSGISSIPPPVFSYNVTWIRPLTRPSSVVQPVNDSVEADIAYMIFNASKVILTDINRVADATYSYAYVEKDPPEYKLGERIIVRINIHNGFGDKLTIGGDDVRVIMKGKYRDAGLAGHVTDHNNGSYTAQVIAAWTGLSYIKVYIVPKEMKCYLQHLRSQTIPQVLYGGFGLDTIIQHTVCDTRTNILLKMYPQICNLTTANFGIPWFCGKPNVLDVSCKDWSTNQYMKEFNAPHAPPFNQTSDELSLVSKTRVNAFIGPITISVRKGKGNEDIWHVKSNLSCSLGMATFNFTSPIGYFFNKKWHMLACRANIAQTPDVLNKCLSKRNIHFLGDSTVRNMLQILTKPYQCVEKKDNPYHLYYECAKNNMTLSHASHGIPYRSPIPRRSIKYTIPLHRRLDDIHTENSVIIISLDAHILFYEINIFLAEVRKITDSLVRLLLRCPKTKIFIMGPFPKVGNGYQYGTDFFSPDVYGQDRSYLWRSYFSNVSNNVFYVNRWDMLLAIGNTEIHQENYVYSAEVDVIFNHVCSGIVTDILD